VKRHKQHVLWRHTGKSSERDTPSECPACEELCNKL